MASLASLARSVLSSLPEVSRLSSLRRCTSLFSQSQAADSLYFIEDGLVKLTRTNGAQSRIILGIFGPGHVVGEEVLAEEPPAYYADAETLTAATVVRLPQQVLTQLIAANQEFCVALTATIIQQKIMLAEKVELLCLHDVEYRILHYLAQLSSLVKPLADGEGYQLPITQLELADLIGATRETTSTTLNQLERRGLVRLSRRLLTIPSPDTLLHAASARTNNNHHAAATAVGTN